MKVGRVASNDMEVSHKALASHSDRADIIIQHIVVHDKALWKNMDDILTWIKQDVVLVVDEALHVLLFNETMFGRNHHRTFVRLALDVLSGYADIYLFHVVLRHLGSVGHCVTDRLGSATDIAHHSTFHTN